MDGHPRARTTRALQWGFLALLVVCAAQVGWWYLDQVQYTREVQKVIVESYQADLVTARALMTYGVPADEIAGFYPHLNLGADGAHPAVADAALGALEEVRRRRLNRYGWEGGFFLVVLGASITIVWRALQAEAELRRRQQNFLATVSHEFKSPLASLRLSVDSLARRPAPPERQQVLSQRMGMDLDRLEGLVTNLLDTTRLEDGRLRMDVVPVPVASALSAAVEPLRARAAAQGVTLTTAAPADLVIDADAPSVQTVLTNLLDNALKATTDAPGHTIHVEAAPKGRFAEITVRDDGAGFPPDEASRLWGKFYRPGDEMRRKGGGSGLGLYIVLRMVEAGGGEVDAQSDGPGRGATFVVRWPLSARSREVT